MEEFMFRKIFSWHRNHVNLTQCSGMNKASMLFPTVCVTISVWFSCKYMVSFNIFYSVRLHKLIQSFGHGTFRCSGRLPECFVMNIFILDCMVHNSANTQLLLRQSHHESHRQREESPSLTKDSKNTDFKIIAVREFVTYVTELHVT